MARPEIWAGYTTNREAIVLCGETDLWRAWEAHARGGIVPLRKESPQWGCDRRATKNPAQRSAVPTRFSLSYSFLFRSCFPASTPPRVFRRWLVGIGSLAVAFDGMGFAPSWWTFVQFTGFLLTPPNFGVIDPEVSQYTD